MSFTNELPTVPGDFAWKDDAECGSYILLQVVEWPLNGPGLWVKDAMQVVPLEDYGGLWCRLVPADETVAKEEIEKAWQEGLSTGMSRPNETRLEWIGSRAKKVMEGTA